MNEKSKSWLEALAGFGIQPNQLPSQQLFYWMARPRHPIFSSNDKCAAWLIRAMLSGEAVRFIYLAGSEPGATRSVKVSLVFQHEPEGRIYVAGYCLERASNRIFALEAILAVEGWN